MALQGVLRNKSVVHHSNMAGWSCSAVLAQIGKLRKIWHLLHMSRRRAPTVAHNNVTLPCTLHAYQGVTCAACTLQVGPDLRTAEQRVARQQAALEQRQQDLEATAVAGETCQVEASRVSPIS